MEIPRGAGCSGWSALRLHCADIGGSRNVVTQSYGRVSEIEAQRTRRKAERDAAGIDIQGMLALAQSKALELKTCLTLLARSTDGADPNLATVNNILASLV